MSLTVTFPDGNSKEFSSGVTALDVAKSISEGLARETVAAKVDGVVVDVTMPLTQDCAVEFLKFSSDEGKEVFWHSSAHVLAQAVLRLYPDAKPTIGPPIEDGFYYDFAHLSLKQEDLEKIEAEMKKIVKEDLAVTRIDYASEKEALDDFADNPFKQEIIQEAEGGLSAYSQGEFTDLCRGPHVPRTGMIKAVWLNKLSGAYWRADADNEQLTRVYGVSFPDKKQLKQYKKKLEEAKKRDHRRIATDLDLYTISEEVGPGLILWLPKGNIIKEELENWAKETEKQWGYQRVTTPVLTKEGLFYRSEHLPHYSESMFPPMTFDNEKYYVKPMNCPFHHTIFGSRTRSYRELPLRLAEYGWCHRYEQSGTLFGLMRVRGMQMNDAHIYCAKEDAVKEFVDVIRLHEYYYQNLGITEYSMELALRDPDSDKYHGDEEMWVEAEELMREAMEESGVPYTVVKGGAAFYGPKIDFQIKSVIGREFTASTNQIDLFMPEKFDLQFQGEDGELHTPVCIHRAPLGTHERFIGFLIEHFAGRFPLWLAPEQIAILPISQAHEQGASEIASQLEAKGLRVVIELGDTLKKRVREAQVRQIPLILIVGEKELSSQTVSVRTLDGNTVHGVPVEAFIEKTVQNRDDRELELPQFE